MEAENPEEDTAVLVTPPSALTCGLVMPISAMDGCTAEHWSEVKSIITESVESIKDFKFTVRLVSEADDVGVIQKRIVQNIYASDILVCDVSGKNPNVMFELGMRLAFDKPTVIVKDDKTDYTFDTGIIEHVGYPRDLRFGRMIVFKSLLADKVLATHKAAVSNPDHSTFLKNFGKFQLATLSEDVLPADKIVVAMINDLREEMTRLRRSVDRSTSRTGRFSETSGLARLTAAIRSYRAQNPGADLTTLMKTADFIQDIERKIEARDHFTNREAFEAALERICTALADD